VTLRFIIDILYNFLIEYLNKVLEIVQQKKDQEQVKPQKELLCTWIVELKLNEINEILSKKESDKLNPREKAKLDDVYEAKKQIFKDFLEKHKENV